MKVLVLGSGNIGSVAAEDLAKNMPSTEIVIADKDVARAKKVVERINRNTVSSAQVDVSRRTQLFHMLKDFDLVMGFLPGRFGFTLMEACIEARKDLVDVSYTAENPLTLEDAAAKADIIVVPDCGLAPGISNFLVGHSIAKLNKTTTVHIMVGGLPAKPFPPLDYIITWSPESLIDEYTRKAVIVKQGRRVEVDALSGLETLDFPGVGRLEAFYTDGLRTLAHTVKDARDMWEKTLRYPGHAEKVKALEGLGFFEETRIKVDDVEISPRKMTVKLFEKRLRKPGIRDMVALKVEAGGVKNGKKTYYTYHLLDEYDKKHGITAMARTTAYPMSIVAQLILNRKVKEKGVVPPEKLGVDGEVFKLFSDELEKRGIRIDEERTTG